MPDDTWTADHGVVLARLEDGTLDEAMLAEEARALVAVALGQLKIRGGLVPEARRIAGRALVALRTLTVHARAVYPDWPHADADVASIDVMAAVVDRAAALADDQPDRPGGVPH